MDDAPAADAHVPGDVDYYAGDVYWNGFPEARAAINVRVSGDPELDWIQRFRQLTNGRTFRRALVLNCGNGWVERALHEAGIIESAIGIDFSEDLLEDGRQTAEEAGLDFQYRAMDTNTTAFADEDVDLVVNHAALHHVQYLDRVLRACAGMLPDDGLIVSWDYVGAHRNQWPWDQWEAARLLNRAVPEEHRADVGYPHLPTMMLLDPTEAVHSELIREVVGRYFDLVEEVEVGGGLAYLVLAGKRSLLDAPEEERAPVVEMVMAADARWHEEHPDRPVFWFSVGRPRAEPHADEQLARWTAAEDEREAAATAAGGEYFERTVLQDVTMTSADFEVAADHRLTYAHQLAGERDEANARLARLARLDRYEGLDRLLRKITRRPVPPARP